ncbi:MAG: hypothetical protein LBB08_02340 [Rickettsiales bacterium]|nr:hypothetical protein [Rickettsiales bacterium]
MNDLGLLEITVDSSILFGLVKAKIHLSKQQFAHPHFSAQTPGGGADFYSGAVPGAFCAATPPAAQPETGAVLSPMVGVVYLSPDPDSKPFAQVGAHVSKGDTLCLVEAMKTFNPVKADRDGIVADVLVKDGDTVEFGTPLVTIG